MTVWLLSTCVLIAVLMLLRRALRGSGAGRGRSVGSGGCEKQRRAHLAERGALACDPKGTWPVFVVADWHPFLVRTRSCGVHCA